MPRLFVAFALPAETIRALIACQRRLEKQVPTTAARRFRPVPANNFHLTLRFLGDTPEENVPALCATLDGVAARQRSLTPELAGLGAFPTPATPRAVFADVSATRESTVALMAAIDRALEPLGYAPETRARAPHVTLFRVDKAVRNGPITEALKAYGTPVFGPVEGHTLVVYESELRPEGARYTARHWVPLRG